MPEERELLLKFCQDGCDIAFRQLVERTINVVYGAACRQTGGDAHLAADVTQNVFLAMAQNANRLMAHPSLIGWLYTTTRNIASKAVRSRARRAAREAIASELQAIEGSGDHGVPWREIWPVVDAAIHELGAEERNLVVESFFENTPLPAIAERRQISPNAARMRLERAVEKLRRRLAKRGISSTAAALGVALTNQTAQAAPASLIDAAAKLSFASSPGVMSGLSVGTTLFFMSTTKLVIGITAGLAVGAYAGAYFVGQKAPALKHHLTSEEVHTRGQSTPDDAARPALHSSPASAPQIPSEAVARASSATLERLRILTELRRENLADPNAVFVFRDGRINDAFRQLFGLDHAEYQVLQGSIQSALQKVAALERQNAVVESGPDGLPTIKIKAFAKEGGLIYDEVLTTFRKTLQPERYDAFLALGAEQVEKTLGYFGTADRTLDISFRPNNPPGQRYEVRDEYKLPEGTYIRTLDFESPAAVHKALGGLGALLPETFDQKR